MPDILDILAMALAVVVLATLCSFAAKGAPPAKATPPAAALHATAAPASAEIGAPDDNDGDDSNDDNDDDDDDGGGGGGGGRGGGARRRGSAVSFHPVLRGLEFEDYVRESVDELKSLGYKVAYNKKVADAKGKNHKPDIIIFNPRTHECVVVDVKNYHGTLPPKQVEKLVIDMEAVELAGTYGRCVEGILFCRSDTYFGDPTRELMKESNITHRRESREDLKAYVRGKLGRS